MYHVATTPVLCHSYCICYPVAVVSHLLEYVARGLTVAQLFEIFSGEYESRDL